MRTVAARALCSQPVRWHKGAVAATCTKRGVYRAEGAWFCRAHDPYRPRCEHEECVGNPYALTAAGRYDGVRLCLPHASKKREFVWDATFRRPPAVPCCLCRGSGILRDDRERPLACPCTPAGRLLANGASDAEVLRRLLNDGYLEA